MQAPENFKFISSRRQFLKTSLIGTLLLTSSGWITGCLSSSQKTTLLVAEKEFQFLTAANQTLLQAICPTILDGELPCGKKRRDAMTSLLAEIDMFLSSLPLLLQEEIRQLFDLLNLSTGRILVARVWSRWETATIEEVESFLNHWRTSSLALLRDSHFTLQTLTIAAWYNNLFSWKSIGYPGSPQV